MDFKDFDRLLEKYLIKAGNFSFSIDAPALILKSITDEVSRVYELTEEVPVRYGEACAKKTDITERLLEAKAAFEYIYSMFVMFELLVRTGQVNTRNIVHRTKNVMLARNKEYAEKGDKLSNFKQAAKVIGKHPLTALMGMFVKHLISIHKCWDEVDITPQEIWDEKLGDAQNYMLLAIAICEDYL